MTYYMIAKRIGSRVVLWPSAPGISPNEAWRHGLSHARNTLPSTQVDNCHGRMVKDGWFAYPVTIEIAIGSERLSVAPPRAEAVDPT